MSEQDDYKRTIVYGESALSFIKKNILPAYPRAYEFWYTYAAGFNNGLNREINTLIKSNGHVTSAQMDALYGKFLAPERIGDRLDSVGSQISQEVSGLVAAIEQNANAASDYGDSLEKVGAEIGTLTDPKNLEAFVTSIVQATQTALASNRQLENQLKDSKRQIESLQSDLESIRFESLTDDLTTLGNRRHFDATLERALNEADKSEKPVALMMTDIDHFKQFNDRYGHQTGDQVLRLVAMTTKQHVKPSDTPCRYGGEEFAVIIEGSTPEQVHKMAEEIRQAVMAKELVKRSTGEVLGRITISIGLAFFKQGDTAEGLINRADKALYDAKEQGRNMVRSEADLVTGKSSSRNQVA